MLVLGRKVGDTIMIGDNITVTVVGLEGNQVRLGLAAPREVPILRGELWEKLKVTPQSVEKVKRSYVPRNLAKVPAATSA